MLEQRLDGILDRPGLEQLIQLIQSMAKEKIDREDGKSLFTDEEREKLEGVEEGAQVNVQPDWDEVNDGADSYIKNKPSINSVPLAGDKSFDELGLTEISNMELEALLT